MLRGAERDDIGMRVGVVLAATLLAWTPAVSAQDDLVLHTYPYSAAEIEALYETRPEASRIDPALMPKATVEDGAQLEIRASQSQVAAVWANTAWQGTIAGCGNRLSYSADSTAITPRDDGSFEVAMEGFWLWDVTSRPGELTQGMCTEKSQDLTEFAGTITVSLESGSPVVTAATGLAIPARATITPVAEQAPPDATTGSVTSRDDVGAPLSELDGDVEDTRSGADGDGAAQTEQSPDTADTESTGGAGSVVALIVLFLVTIGVAGWVGWAIMQRFVKNVPTYEQFEVSPFGEPAMPTTSRHEQLPDQPSTIATPTAPGPADVAEQQVSEVFLELAVVAGEMSNRPPLERYRLRPGNEWVQACEPGGSEADTPAGGATSKLRSGEWYQARWCPGSGDSDGTWRIYDAGGKSLIEERPESGSVRRFTTRPS